MKKLLLLLTLMAMLAMTMLGCSQGEKADVKSSEAAGETIETAGETAEIAAEANKEAGTLILATTTSTRDSGLLDAILGDFTEKTNIEVKVVAVGTGQALQMGRDGEADVLLVHAKASEEEFVAEGYGTERFDVMYNDFVVVGPATDPADINTVAPNDVVLGFKTIYDTKSAFVSRGDDSGTHKKELSLWKEAGIELKDEEFYVSAGKGMGEVLTMASEMEAYTLTDRATYLSMKDNLELNILLEKDIKLFNQYGVIPVNPEINELINKEAATLFVEWILSDDTQATIAEFGVAEFGMPLFTPNANK